MKRARKKSQAEAFGLVLIVALVFVVFVIMTRMEQGRTSSDVKSTFERNELSSSTINTMLSTVLRGCSDKTFSEVASDCVRDPNSRCANQQTSCANFVSGARNILNEVFNRVNLDYYMRFTVNGRMLPEVLEEPIPDDSACAGDLRGEDFILPLNPGELIITLVVCQP